MHPIHSPLFPPSSASSWIESPTEASEKPEKPEIDLRMSKAEKRNDVMMSCSNFHCVSCFTMFHWSCISSLIMFIMFTYVYMFNQLEVAFPAWKVGNGNHAGRVHQQCHRLDHKKFLVQRLKKSERLARQILRIFWCLNQSEHFWGVIILIHLHIASHNQNISLQFWPRIHLHNPPESFMGTRNKTQPTSQYPSYPIVHTKYAQKMKHHKTVNLYTVKTCSFYLSVKKTFSTAIP